MVLASSGITNEAGAATKPTAATEFKALTKVIDNLEHGKPAKVTTEMINVPGPIGEAKAQPLVFWADGKPFLAYTQTNQANFNQKRPADVAENMAIIQEPPKDIGMPLEEAHLDKAYIVVGPDQEPVAYSIGGDSAK